MQSIFNFYDVLCYAFKMEQTSVFPQVPYSFAQSAAFTYSLPVSQGRVSVIMQGTPKRGRNGNAAGNKPNALMMAGSLGGGGGLGSPLPSDDEEGDSGVDDAQRAERFATTLQGNRFREVSKHLESGGKQRTI